MFELNLENANHNIVNLDDGIKYLITDITGLNPPSASIFTSKSPSRKGVKYNGSTLNERNIIITIKLLGDIEKNRNDLYDWIDTEQYVKIHYRNDIKNVYCEGHIEECEFNPYTDNEVINLAIICEDPYWKDLSEISKEISTILKHFTFSFAIDDEGIPFSTIRENNTTNVFNYGADTGIRIIVKCLNDIENLTIYNPDDISKQFKINTKLLKDWVVEINTESSPKFVRAYKPDGTEENLLKYVGRNATWFTLKRGNNKFGYTTDSVNTDVEISINYVNKYLGV